MIRFYLFLSVLSLAYASETASLRGGETKSNVDFDAEEEGLLLQDDKAQHRALGPINQRVPCNGSSGPINWFTVKFEVIPQGGFNTNQCTTWRKKNLAKDINKLLLSYGVGDDGVGDDASFLAEVCQNSQRRLLREAGKDEEEGDRELWKTAGVSLIYPGGGKCRYCPRDDFDARRELGGSDPEDDLDEEHRELNDGNGDPNWFKNIYAPSLQNLLRNAFINDVAGKHVACLGRGPRANVNVTPVRRKPRVC